MKFNQKGYKFAFQVGIPLVGFMCGGIYLLGQFLQTSFEVKDNLQGKNISLRKFSLEEEHENMMKSLDIDNFTLSRIPRPEDNQNPKSKNKS